MNELPPASGEPLTSYYVERNLEIDEFVNWATGDLGQSSPRLRSIIGPPGAGKGTFLYQLRLALQERSRVIVLWLDAQDAGQSDDSLHAWLERQAEQIAGRLGLPRFINDRTVSFLTAWHAFARDVLWVAYPVILLVDGFDEATPSARTTIEQLLVIFLSMSNARIVLTCRDEYALIEPALRWEEEILQLESLPDPAKQIRQRLAVAGQVDPELPREEWEYALDRQIADANLTPAQLEALVDELSTSLTSNPYINLRLLQQKLAHLEKPLDAADYRACLEQYITRAGLSADYYVPNLIDRVRDKTFIRSGRIVWHDYAGLQRVELVKLLETGIVEIDNYQNYQVEPDVMALVRRLQ